jgi:hypothetical protein
MEKYGGRLARQFRDQEELECLEIPYLPGLNSHFSIPLEYQEPKFPFCILTLLFPVCSMVYHSPFLSLRWVALYLVLIQVCTNTVATPLLRFHVHGPTTASTKNAILEDVSKVFFKTNVLMVIHSYRLLIIAKSST